jgi:putative phosphoesterase
LSRLAIISDVHANLPALQAVLLQVDKLGADRIISLGDIAGYGPFVNECIDLLRSRNVFNLMGNHDLYVVQKTGCPRSLTATTIIKKQIEVITEENISWLAQSPRMYGLPDMSMVHGGWNDPIDEYMLKIPYDYFSSRSEKMFFSGHTHVQGIWTLRDKCYVNPGSVGQPRDGDPRAAFAIVEDHDVELHRVAYEISEYRRACEDAGFPSRVWECLVRGTRIGGRINSVTVLQP